MEQQPLALNTDKATTKKKKSGSVLIILILGTLSTVSPFSIDMYLPAFSQIAKDFNTTPATIALSLSSYFVGLAIGQLIYGPLLDRFGRKRPLYVGLILYILTCIGCMQVHSAEALIAFRFAQALGGCVALVAAMAMVRDFFPVEESARIFSLLMLVIGLSPLLAPTAGGFITASLGWQWIFILLVIIVLLILLLVVFCLPEAHQPDPTVSLKAKPMLATFLSIIRNKQFYTYTLAGAFSFGTIFIYVAGSPLIFMENFHVSPQAYGGIFALLSVGFIGSNQVNILLLRKYKSEHIFRMGIICQLIVNSLFLLGTWNNWYGLYGTVAMFFISLCCIGFTYPNASALALAPFTRNVGSASALIGFLQIGIAGLVSSGVGLLSSASNMPIIAMLTGSSLIAFFVLWLGNGISFMKAGIQLPE